MARLVYKFSVNAFPCTSYCNRKFLIWTSCILVTLLNVVQRWQNISVSSQESDRNLNEDKRNDGEEVQRAF